MVRLNDNVRPANAARLDVLVIGGSIDTVFLVRPMTPEAKDWIDDNVPDDATWFGGSLVVEHRYLGDLLQGMQQGGLKLAATGGH